MYDQRHDADGCWRREFLVGVDEFITFATSQVQLMDNEKIRSMSLFEM